MKNTLLLIFLFISIIIYSQNDYTIIVDGKEVVVDDNGTTKQVRSTDKSRVKKAISGVHVVKAKETLYSISRLYNLTVEELCEINNISKSTHLQIGKSLCILNFNKAHKNQIKVQTPVTFTNTSYHIVKKEDTLYNISKRYGLTVVKLKELNNLNSNIITINQRLRIN